MEICFSCNFFHVMNYYPCFDLFSPQTFKNTKFILSSWALQKSAADQVCPWTVIQWAPDKHFSLSIAEYFYQRYWAREVLSLLKMAFSRYQVSHQLPVRLCPTWVEGLKWDLKWKINFLTMRFSAMCSHVSATWSHGYGLSPELEQLGPFSVACSPQTSER